MSFSSGHVEQRPPKSLFARKLLVVPSFVSLANETEVVKVVVGQAPPSTWVIHETLLTTTSRFAKSALSLPFLEKGERTIKLPEENPAIFESFVRFLYTNVVDFSSLDSGIELYLLADRLQASTLCDKIFTAITFEVDTFTTEQILHVLNNTPTSDKLHHACIQRICRDIRFNKYHAGVSVTRELCEKHSWEILALLLGKHDEIVKAPVVHPDKSSSEAAKPHAADGTGKRSIFGSPSFSFSLPASTSNGDSTNLFSSQQKPLSVFSFGTQPASLNPSANVSAATSNANPHSTSLFGVTSSSTHLAVTPTSSALGKTSVSSASTSSTPGSSALSTPTTATFTVLEQKDSNLTPTGQSETSGTSSGSSSGSGSGLRSTKSPSAPAAIQPTDPVNTTLPNKSTPVGQSSKATTPESAS
ncbi:uncharacterized protein Z518_01357 [Rhinocladiella mackenziei CBS 650.93]|uniref:BTB domain-containing protein n=1 Tax=Rhinocladiella mackenziei CBS 650.93 TaxID=1442369 RepID=A0A0D2JLD7_9EURO|nr:uncharacterized protein Z518_01357 [Rhinocladiella mackenziei CBS 650.93]KIX10275.1 hypothetical protein Z518_01357 [Rhinocladiella mackenziei CBS 650.93]